LVLTLTKYLKAKLIFSGEAESNHDVYV
jgi:hypothetical protein